MTFFHHPGDTFAGLRNVTLATSNGLVYSWGQNLLPAPHHKRTMLHSLAVAAASAAAIKAQNQGYEFCFVRVFCLVFLLSLHISRSVLSGSICFTGFSHFFLPLLFATQCLLILMFYLLHSHSFHRRSQSDMVSAHQLAEEAAAGASTPIVGGNFDFMLVNENASSR